MRLHVPLWATLALTAVLAMAGRGALGNEPQSEDTPPALFAIVSYVVAPAARAAGQETRYLWQMGVAPDSIKGRIVDAWFERLRADPAVAIAVPGGAAGLEAELRDDEARDRLIKSGIARLAPEERLAYFMLLTKYVGKVVRGDCHGVASMQDIVDRVSVSNMSDADAAEYFSLLHRIVTGSLLAAPLTPPTPLQLDMALRHLDDAVNAELSGDPQAVARMTRMTHGGPGASMADVCWASAILMQSVVEMGPPDRDTLLLYMLDADGRAPGQGPEAAPTH
jgi:hypothetical protein